MKKFLFLTVMCMRKKANRVFAMFSKRNSISFFIAILFIPVFTHAQVGNWTFNNTLTATAGAHNTAGSASLGSIIPTAAFNGGTVYYGEDGWPSGALDANAYVQFSLAPNSGYTLTISTLVMNIRRSTTGVSGSGPNNWSLRSSLDGYTGNISSGTLTTSSTTAYTVVLPGTFTGINSTVTFRLYGYNATVSSGGGLNRFVFDNITANGSIILPIIVDDFKSAITNNNTVQLAWTLENDESINSMQVERSSDNSDFSVIKNIFPNQNTGRQQYSFMDEPTVNDNGDFYYRVKIMTYSGKLYYSPVQKISFTIKNNFSIIPIAAHQGENIRCNVKTDMTATYQFSLYNLNGARIATKSIVLNTGNQMITMDNASLIPGIYIIAAERTGKKIAEKMIVQ
ncbi:MAG: T9SS type A sorting domain-containing protein [Bacteroidetes bacterium]|nr:T9SS type A sorting domain-containing protein [Bacteroidota bacterium]